MPEPGIPTFEQLKVFLTVVEAGSFTAAAKRLGRAVSAVSYTIGNLEQQLGVSLFNREQSRTPRLTEAGSAVLSKARVVAVGIDDLRASVRALLKGLEAEVTLVVDVMLPNARLIDAVQAFEATFPTVTLRLHVEALSAVAQLVRRDGAMIGIGGGLLDVEPELELIHVGDVEMIPVAAPNHPLARGRPNASGAASNHRQLVLTVRTPFSEGPDLGIFSADVWRLADLGAKHALLLAGVGWGNMPEPHVRADLAAGRLVRLELLEARNALYPLRALHRTAEPPGPAAAWLIQRFVDQVSAF
jgi:DNA-binding transcriptional LysR family regulator